ncbi:amidase [Virgibacillus alimentarius]|uniref:amidase n=1 Tax=Virgibacillus alimentarius TaxID=698769 RepID=UPI00049392B3|nr:MULTISPECIES: amidase [Virgibacillus]HLR65562.1 amidase [Virgibacillus sp.]
MFTINDLIEGYANKQYSPVEITRAYIERAKQNSHLNAYITLTEDTAIEQAKIAEKRWHLGEAGRLEGIPLSYKDNYHTKNVATTSGSKVDADFVPDEHSNLVQTLTNEGAVMIGKNNMHEFAFGITNNNPFYGPSRNPWNTDLISGGSSGGSAVSVATNTSIASLGTDTGGSIRIPSACCGLVGLKPTNDLLSKSGITLLSWSLDHAGPITRNVSDLIVMMEALVGREISETKIQSTDLLGLKVGVPSNFFTEQIEQEVLDAYHQTLQKLEELGAVLVEVKVPDAEEALALTFTLATGEAGFLHRERMESRLDKYGEDVRQILQSSPSLIALDYMEALHRQQEISNSFDELMEEIDVLVAPTLPIAPKPIGKEIVTINGGNEPIFNCMIRYTSYFNLTGHPVLALPVGITSDSQLPVGVQLAGNKRDEGQLLKIAKIFERHYLHDFYKQREKVCNASKADEVNS